MIRAVMTRPEANGAAGSSLLPKHYLTMDDDHDTIRGMNEMKVSEFKATCLAVLERIRKTGEPLLITKRGQPLAQVVPPPAPDPAEESSFGCMQATAREIGDVIAPLPEELWEALQ